MDTNPSQPDRRSGPSRRESDHWVVHEIESVREQLKDQGERLVRLETTVDDIRRDTADVREILDSARGFFKVLGVIGFAAKWLVTVGAAVAAIWFAITGLGGPPRSGG